MRSSEGHWDFGFLSSHSYDGASSNMSSSKYSAIFSEKVIVLKKKAKGFVTILINIGSVLVFIISKSLY